MKYSAANPPLVCMMTQSSCYKGTKKMTVRGILWHDTAAGNANIKRYVQPDDNAKDRSELLKILGTNSYKNDWNHKARSAGVNAFVGKLADGSISSVQALPWNYAPWGCGSGSKGSCNNGWIQFEICDDGYSSAEYFQKVYNEAIELTAYLCKTYGLDPKGTVTYNGVKVPVILCHKESHLLKLGSNHGDVLTWFKKFGKTMDDVRNDVAAVMEAGVGESDSQDDAKTASNASEAVFVPYVVRITASVLNVRKGAGTSYAVVRTVKKGEAYTIVEEKNGWGKLKSGAGWIYLSYTVKR